ncbi:MAG: hypothetical protein GEU82_15940, partial [Luteitalea sp.]|nr:hypothetical protein [Luteitalea sp.]
MRRLAAGAATIREEVMTSADLTRRTTGLYPSRRSVTPGRSRLPALLWASCAAFIVYGTTMPFSFTSDANEWLRQLDRMLLNPPIVSGAGPSISIPDFTSNVLLFLPFGAFGLWTCRRRSIAARIALVTGLGCVLSAGVELLQLATVDRTGSLSDLLANGIGACAGAVAAALTGRSSAAFLRRAASAGLTTAPSFFPLLVAALLVCIGAWEPFDVTLDVGSLVPKLHAVLRDPWQGGPARGEVLSLTGHFLFSSMLVVWLKDIGVAGATRAAIVISTVMAFGLEAGQWLVAGRMPGLHDALMAAAGSLGGVAAGAAFPGGRPRPAWTGGLLLLTMIGAATGQLSPFDRAPEM